MIIKKNKILFLHGSNDLYGASKVLIEVINLLFEQGYEIHLILPYKGPLDTIFENKTIIYYKNLGVFRKKYFHPMGLLNRFYKIFSSIFFINKIIRLNNIDIVYTNTSVIIAGGISAKINSINSFFHIHEIPTNRFYLFIIRRIIKVISDKIILVSKAVESHWRFRSKSKLAVIYNGFDIKDQKVENKNPKNGIVFSSIGRLIPYKGHLYLLKIAKKLKEKNFNFIFYIIGDTFPGYENYELSLKKFVNNNDLLDNVIFTGFRDDASSFLKKSNFFIHTAIQPDPLPTVILESINLDIPVIATNLGGAIEILDAGKGGLLIPENNVNESISLIFNFINNPEEIIKKRSYAKQHIKRYFTPNKFKEKILSLFK